MDDMIVVHTAAPRVEQRDDFLRFVTGELQPWVATEYRAASLTVLVGDVESIVSAPESFATIAIGPDQSVHVSYRGDQNSFSWSDEPHNALREGLERLFDGWELANLSSLASQPGDDGWAQIDAHYAALSDRFGYRVVPHEDVADVAARSHAQQGR